MSTHLGRQRLIVGDDQREQHSEKHEQRLREHDLRGDEGPLQARACRGRGAGIAQRVGHAAARRVQRRREPEENSGHERERQHEREGAEVRKHVHAVDLAFAAQVSAHQASVRPAAPPTTASSVDSVTSCRSRRARDAPRDRRTAISWRRPTAAATMRELTFIHATSRMRPPIPKHDAERDDLVVRCAGRRRVHREHVCRPRHPDARRGIGKRARDHESRECVGLVARRAG